MNKRTLLIIVSVILVLAVTLIVRITKKKNIQNKTNQSNSDSGIIVKIPKIVQDALSGFDEGEKFRYDGKLYQVLGGKWELV